MEVMGNGAITPDPVNTFSKWWKVAVSVVGGIGVIIGTFAGGVLYLVEDRATELQYELEEQMGELAEAVISDDIEHLQREIDRLERHVERLENR